MRSKRRFQWSLRRQPGQRQPGRRSDSGRWLLPFSTQARVRQCVRPKVWQVSWTGTLIARLSSRRAERARRLQDDDVARFRYARGPAADVLPEGLLPLMASRPGHPVVRSGRRNGSEEVRVGCKAPALDGRHRFSPSCLAHRHRALGPQAQPRRDAEGQADQGAEDVADEAATPLAVSCVHTPHYTGRRSSSRRPRGPGRRPRPCASRP
jgi:hypothetical protein